MVQLGRELDYYSSWVTDKKCISIYIGGGNPGLIPLTLLNTLEKMLASKFDLSSLREFTLEINPENMNKNLINYFDASMINRLSMGVQTLHNPQATGRRHDSTQVEKAVSLIHASKINNFNLDLIFGLPDNPLSVQKQTIAKLCTFSPKHISFYGLGIEKGCKYYEEEKLGYKIAPTETEWIDFYLEGREQLIENGFGQYEISNYSQTGFPSLHNLGYWLGQNYIGVGSAAGSRWDKMRWYNFFPPQEYLKIDFRNKNRPNSVLTDEYEELDNFEIYKERVMTEMRLTSGLRRDKLVNSCLSLKKLENLLKKDYIWAADDRIGLTVQGMLVSDSIFQTLMSQPNPL
jgi:oxygen-independent coproporphyrinogen-3 oxidase